MINRHFEPVWVSLRPVPRVTIDFGNGKVVKRTLHGNIATWVCLSDGTAVDVLPGLYEPRDYVSALGRLKTLHAEISQWQDVRQRWQALKRHHQAGLDAISRHPVSPGEQTGSSAASALERDSRWNEQVRRRSIHRHLRDRGLVKPDDVTRWLYREVLHADLDDPYLGLRNVLFDDYPFAVEDARAATRHNPGE